MCLSLSGYAYHVTNSYWHADFLSSKTNAAFPENTDHSDFLCFYTTVHGTGIWLQSLYPDIN